MTHSAFTLLNTRHLSGLDIEVSTYQHHATGLIHYHLACNNSENALMIGFATQPMTSRGEAHILEHVVLCGSQKYPVRDPFFSMIKRSLNTFMNAMTASDWTVYPFASQNKKDYFNLMQVYLDAVFFPNIHPLDFAQEGIRIELDDEGKPCYHGIVFNEMKGAMSGEIDQLYYALAPHIFDTTTYHYNSGGDPKEIPKLSHAELVKFHQTYYHPSNAVVMSFGDIKVDEIQTMLQEGVLSRFDDVEYPAKSKRFFVTPEVRHSKPIAITDTYSSDTKDKAMTHQVLAWLLPAITDPKMRLALRLMEGVLIEHSGLPLRAYLESTPLGSAPSPLLGLDDSHYEMVFYAGLRGSEPYHSQQISDEILALLNEVASRPIDEETIDTILHQMEIDQRHIGGDGMPYGLNLMLEGFSTAIHGGDPVDVWQVDEHLAWLKKQLTDPMWLPSLIKTHLVDNPHRVQLTLIPDAQKASRLIKEEQSVLDELNASLTDEDRQHIDKQTQELLARQALVDDIELLPKVGLEDIPAKIAFATANTHSIAINGTPSILYQYDAGTNGLYYYQLLMKIEDEAILGNALLPLYLSVLAELGTSQYDARKFQARQAAHSSGVTARISQRTDIEDSTQMSTYLVLAVRSLASKHEAVTVLKEVLTDSVFDETERMSELLKQRQMSWQARLSGAGHAYAMQTASRATSKASALEYAFSGLPALGALKAFLATAEHDDSAWQVLSAGLASLHAQLSQLPKSAILVCEAPLAKELGKVIADSLAQLPSAIPTNPSMPDEFVQLQQIYHALMTQVETSTVASDSAWMIATNVYHNASCYLTVPSGHEDAPALMVLAPFLRNGYLHGAIREKGGAYGGGASYDGNSASLRFYSYRDPQCAATFEHFTKAIDWLLTSEHEPRQLEEAILGIIAGMDKPGSPAGDAIKSCFSVLHGRDKAWQTAMRAKILAVTIEDLKAVTKRYLKDKPYTRATLAPIDKTEEVRALGFEIKRLA
ncbi:MAG: insulinase family protein [Moraxella sp.]|nr:insulinase family protein [Moraxella sp.]